MKKGAYLAAVLVGMFVLSGCIEVVYEITVDDDDAEKITMKLGAPSMLAPYMGEIINEVQNEGFYVKTDTQGDKVWIIGNKEFKKGLWDIPALPGSVTVTSVTRDVFQVDDYVLFKKYTLDVEYQYQSNKTEGSGGYSDSVFSVPVKFIVTLPGRIVETNAHERTDQTAVWNYVIARNGTIAMKLVTTKLNWGLIWTVLIFGGLIAGALVYVVVRSARGGPGRRPPALRTRVQALPSGRAIITPSLPQPAAPPARPAAPPAQTTAYTPRPATGPAAPAAGATYWVVTLSMPPDPGRAQGIIATLARKKNKSEQEIIDQLKAQRLTITFSTRELLDKNLPVLTRGGFSPKVTEGKR
jgi:hypothetical protein